MNILDQLRDPALPASLREISAVLLPVAGTLLGLVYAGLIYWFQGALERLTYTKDLLEDLIAAHGKILLDLLVGASLVSLFAYFDLPALTSISFWIVTGLLILDLLRSVASRGYFITLFSTKSIPQHYGPLRSFLRKLWNAGIGGWVPAVVVATLTVAYPLWISWSGGPSWRLSEDATSLYLLMTTAFSLIQVRSLLVEAIGARKMSQQRLLSENEERAQHLDEPAITWDYSKRDLETRILTERLASIGVRDWMDIPSLADAPAWSSRMLHDAPVIGGPPWVKEDGSCHLNIFAPYLLTDDEMRAFIFRWARRMLTTVAESNAAVSKYSLSFFRKEDAGEPQTHLAMIRAGKGDVLRAKDSNLSDRDFIRALPGRYFSPAVA